MANTFQPDCVPNINLVTAIAATVVGEKKNWGRIWVTDAITLKPQNEAGSSGFGGYVTAGVH